jgi:pilus assembly protein CpaC
VTRLSHVSMLRLFVPTLVFAATLVQAQVEVTATNSDTITVRNGKSQTVRTPWPVKRISLTNPDIADVQALQPESLVVMGKAVGTTDLLLWNEKEESLHYSIDVIADLRKLERLLASLFPGLALQSSQSGDVVIVSGTSLERATRNGCPSCWRSPG